MLPEAGAFELIFLAAVALIVVGPKDLPVLLRKVGQWTAKMRGLAAEFRASFDEMARQSELDELRKEVEALRTGQFAADAKPDLESHVADINDHLSHNYWDASSQADPVQLFSDVGEGDETAALPPPGSRTPPMPKKLRAAAAAQAEASAQAEAAQAAAKAAKPKARAKATPPAKAAPTKPIAQSAVKKTAAPNASTPKAPAPKPAAPKKPATKKPVPNKPAPEAAEI